MKKIISLLCVLAFSTYTNAQSAISNGSICPDITITDTKGNQQNLYSYCNQGKYVLIDFFAYWCGPCKQYAPNVEAFCKKYGCNTGNVIVLGNESDPNGNYAKLINFYTDAGIDTTHAYPTGFGMAGNNSNNALSASLFDVGSYPTTVLIGPDKKMIHNWVNIADLSYIESVFPAGALSLTPCSAPMSIAQTKTSTIQFQLASNLINNNCDLLITSNKNETVIVLVSNLFGTKISDYKFMAQLGTNNFNINMDMFPAGIYLFTCFVNGVNTTTLKAIKK